MRTGDTGLCESGIRIGDLMFCVKCKMRYAEENFAPLCYICGLKSKGFYRSAIKTLTNPHTGEIGGWWGFHTNWDFKVGWSFAPSLWWILIAINILNFPGLNRTCKVPEFTKGVRKDGWPASIGGEKSLRLLGESAWRIKAAYAYFPDFAGRKKYALV